MKFKIFILFNILCFFCFFSMISFGTTAFHEKADTYCKEAISKLADFGILNSTPFCSLLPERSVIHAGTTTLMIGITMKNAMHTPLQPVDEEPIITPIRPIDKEPVITPIRPIDKEPILTPLHPIEEEPILTPISPIDKGPIYELPVQPKPKLEIM